MSLAIAIFVKTPGFSPVKTRLAAELGIDAAEVFHRLAARATAEVACACTAASRIYWAVAEDDIRALDIWRGLAAIPQGAGELGDRLDHVYRTLLQSHDRVLLIGADAPQLAPAMLDRAAAVLEWQPYVMGPAADGGFWLFGGSRPVAASVWRGVVYSRPDTASALAATLDPGNSIGWIDRLRDVDEIDDLRALDDALASSTDLLPAQRELRHWIESLPVRERIGTTSPT